MQRALSLYLPRWALERFVRRRGLARGRPVLLVREEHGRELVAEASLHAQRAGVRTGMTLAHARALLTREPVVAQAAPEEDAHALCALARFIARRWSPTVAPDPPRGILCDIAGCGHLFGGERALVRSLLRACGALGFSACAGVAPTVGVAWAVARFGARAGAQAVHIAPGGERAAVAPLPVVALRVDEAAACALGEVGVTTVAQVLALPRPALPSRYGAQLLLRVDQALGNAFEPVLRAQEEAVCESGLDLPGGATQPEAVALAVRACVEDVCAQLARREAGLHRLAITFARMGAAEAELVVQVSRRSRDAALLMGLLRPRLEKLHLGFGIEHVRARAQLVAGVAHGQSAFAPQGARGTHDDAARAAMLDAIANRLGAERVLVPGLAQSHIPERAARTEVFGRGGGMAAGGELRADSLPPRPSRLLAEPVPVEVVALSPDGPVLQVRLPGNNEARNQTGGQTGGQGAVRRVRACAFPERVGGEWWRVREGTRDYFRVQDESGAWLWLWRDASSGAWFLQGVWE